MAGVRGRVVGVIGEGEEGAIDGQGEKKLQRRAHEFGDVIESNKSMLL